MIKSKIRPGFTIIEVVLVLAIAGLIFLMVFIALPALRRNQHDTQRKNDMSRLSSAIESYKVNNRGSLPFDVWPDSSKVVPETDNKNSPIHSSVSFSSVLYKSKNY
ncbi:MAG: type II secretion system protein [Candidatus Sacchiramonaceae bacterium]|nr:type II secretion system protein [Candidatus Saccharimonadaceae bacterium]